MLPDRDYVPVESKAPFMGFSVALPSTEIGTSYSPFLNNAIIRDGVVRRRGGYVKIGQTLEGAVLGFEEFGPIGQDPVLVAMTDERQYYYDATNDIFIDISKRTKETFAINAVDTGTKTFTHNSADITDSFPAGQQFRVTGSTGNDGWYTVVSSSFSTNTDIIVEETIPDTTADGNMEVDEYYVIDTATAAPTNQFVHNGVDITLDFPPGTKFSVERSTGNDGTYTVLTSVFSTNTTITTVEDVPDGTNDGFMTLIDELAPVTAGNIDYEIATDLSSRRLFMTNGVDRVRFWTGETGHKFEEWYPTYTDFVTCQSLSVFSEYMFLGGIVLSSQSEPQVVAWSNAADFDDFESGSSGVQILHQLVGDIEAMLPLGDRLVIFSHDTIVNGAYVGSPLIFAFETIIPKGTRLVSPKGVIPFNVGHVFLSEENVYVFDGTRGMRTVGDNIREDYKVRKDQSNLHKVATLNDWAKRTVYISLPDQEGGSTIYTVEYNIFDLRRMIWSKERYTDTPRAFGFLTQDVTLLWEDAVWETTDQLWSEEVGIWGSEAEQAEFPIRIFGTEAGEVFKVTEDHLTDDGTSFEMIYDTKDFTVPEVGLSVLGRWGEIELEVQGESVTVEVSTDQGGSYTVISTETLDGTLQTVQVPLDLMSRTLRVRLRSSLPLKIRWVRCWVHPGAPQ